MKTVLVNCNIKFVLPESATREDVDYLMNLVNSEIGSWEMESQPEIVKDSIGIVEERYDENFVGLDEQEEEIRQLSDRLFALREKFEAEAKVNEIAWIDETLDQVKIGYLKEEADSDQQRDFEGEGLEVTYAEAKKALYVRFKNFCDSIDVNVKIYLPEYTEL